MAFYKFTKNDVMGINITNCCEIKKFEFIPTLDNCHHGDTNAVMELSAWNFF